MSFSFNTDPIDPDSFVYRIAYWWKAEQPKSCPVCSKFWRFFFSLLILTPLVFIFGVFFFGKRPAVFKGDPAFDDARSWEWRTRNSNLKLKKWRYVSCAHLPKDSLGNVMSPFHMLLMVALFIMIVGIVIAFFPAIVAFLLIAGTWILIALAAILIAIFLFWCYVRIQEKASKMSFPETVELPREYAHSVIEKICPIRPVAWDRSLLKKTEDV